MMYYIIYFHTVIHELESLTHEFDSPTRHDQSSVQLTSQSSVESLSVLPPLDHGSTCIMPLDRNIATPVQYNSFKIVFDNIDIAIKTRFVRSGRFENKSLHYINSYAVQRRIDFGSLSDLQPHTCANSPEKKAALMLPSVEDDRAIRDVFITHVSRILVTHMEYFKMTFDGVVDWHIKHDHYKEMSAKSTMVSTY